jgi:hypothetical protein
VWICENKRQEIEKQNKNKEDNIGSPVCVEESDDVDDLACKLINSFS